MPEKLFGSGRGANAPKNPTNAFWHPWRGNQQHVGHSLDYLWKKRHKFERAGRIVRWTIVWARTWKPDDSKPSERRAKARLIIKGLADPDFFDIESQNPTLTREGVMTVLQSVCSHGYKLQFGDVQQAFNTGDPIKRKQPLCVRMPPDGVPGEPREVWVKLLKTVNGLSDGTRKWTNCFLATARDIGFETSVLESCVLVLRSPQQKYNVSLEWPSTTLLVGETKSGNKQSPS